MFLHHGLTIPELSTNIHRLEIVLKLEDSLTIIWLWKMIVSLNGLILSAKHSLLKIWKEQKNSVKREHTLQISNQLIRIVAWMLKRKGKVIKKKFDDTDSSSDDCTPLARGQNLIRKDFSHKRPLKSQEPCGIQENKHMNDLCLEPVPDNISNNCTLASPLATTSQNSRKNCSTPVSRHEFNQISDSREVDFNLRRTAHFSSDLTPILKEITEMKFYMKENRAILSRLEHSMYNSNRNVSGVENTSTCESTNSFLEELPCQTTQHLEEVNSMIDEQKYMKELVTFLYLAGGNNPHKGVYMAMQKLFDKKLALLYSGQGKKKKIPFCSMKSYQAVFAAIRKRYPEVTDDSIKKSVSLFLATAKSRLSGRSNSATPAEG